MLQHNNHGQFVMLKHYRRRTDRRSPDAAHDIVSMRRATLEDLRSGLCAGSETRAQLRHCGTLSRIHT